MKKIFNLGSILVLLSMSAQAHAIGDASLFLSMVNSKDKKIAEFLVENYNLSDTRASVSLDGNEPVPPIEIRATGKVTGGIFVITVDANRNISISSCSQSINGSCK